VRYALFVVFVLSIVGCTSLPIVVISDGATVPSDAGVTADAGPMPEPEPGSECDQQDDCSACNTCSYAPRQTCNNLALGCEENAECLALLECVNRCADGACVQSCGQAHTSATAQLVALYQCMLCDACPADCRAHRAVWCEAPPF
jgi:hypothetical protein